MENRKFSSYEETDFLYIKTTAIPSSVSDRLFVDSVMTPHFMEDINFSMKELHSSQREVSIIFYMQKIFPGTEIVNIFVTL